MLLNAIAVRDSKTALFDRPFFVRHTGDALREWDIVRKDPNTKFGKNPEDFQIFQIGTYDDETGKMETIQPHIHLGNGV